jgi:hypothetical protein
LLPLRSFPTTPFTMMIKNKKTLISLSILLLVIGSYFLLRRDTGTTLDASETAFAITDSKAVDKIFMRSRYQNASALLEKNEEGIWRVNNKYDADGAKVDMLLTAAKEMRVKYPVSKDFWDQVIRNLSSKGTKVELYAKGKLLKTYYVGGPTPDHQGTFVWMENAKKPYVVHIEGFRGYLTPRFFVSERDWRSKIIYKYEAEEIEWVRAEWSDDPAQSFTLYNGEEGPTMSGYSPKGGVKNLNENLLRSYLNYFERLAYEGFPIDMREKDIDSVYSQTKPFFVLSVKPKNKEVQKLQFHYKGLKRDSYQQLDFEGVKLPYEIDAYYAFFNDNGKELLQVQEFVFGKVMKKGADFLLE